MYRFNVIKFVLFVFLTIVICSCGGGSNTHVAELKGIVTNINSNKILTGTMTQATATGIYSDGSTGDLTQLVTWQSSDENIAHVESGGRIFGKLSNSVKITASYHGITSDLLNFDVVDASLAAISINVSANVIPINIQTTATASAYFGNQSIQNISQHVKWISNDEKILSIDANGVITTHGVGSTVIFAMFHGVVSNKISVTVTSSSLVSIGINANTNLIHAGGSVLLVATGYFSDGTQLDLTKQVLWSSSAPSVLSILQPGKGIANDEGQATISAFYGSVTSNTLQFSVNKVTLNNIAIYLNNNNVPVGTILMATAKGYYSDGSTADLTSDVVWRTTDLGVANITTTGEITANKTGSTTISAYFAGVDSNSLAFSVSSANLNSISIHVLDSNIPIGLKTQAIATGSYSDGTRQDISSQVVWSSSNLEIANVASNGQVTANKVGSTNLTASFDGITSNKLVFGVRVAALKKIEINVADNNIPVGTTVNITAKGCYSDNTIEDLTELVKWSSSDENVANVDKSGNVTGSKKGITTLIASLNGLDSNSLPVAVSDAELKELVINLDKASVPNGSLTKATATGYYSDDTKQDLTKVVAWSSSNDQIANISEIGEIQSFKVGDVNISANYGNKSAKSLALNVTNAALQRIAININDNNIAIGLNTYATATGYYSDGSRIDITNQVNWNSNDNGLANINTDGKISGVKEGYVTIHANMAGVVSDPVTLKITSAKLKSIDVTLTANNIPAGIEINAIAYGNYTNGMRSNITQEVSWLSTDPTIANISSQGLIVSNKSGNVHISASFGDVVSDTHSINIIEATLQRINITANKTIVPIGMGERLTAIGYYSDGSTQDLTNQVIWKLNGAPSSYPEIVTPSADGKYTIKKEYAQWVDSVIYAEINGVVSNEVAIGDLAFLR